MPDAIRDFRVRWVLSFCRARGGILQSCAMRLVPNAVRERVAIMRPGERVARVVCHGQRGLCRGAAASLSQASVG
jgi:hypothetical protein